jgi:hypothetical protein
LFPTRIRSAAQTAILTAAVIGSILGLVGVGLLASSLKVGEAVAILLPDGLRQRRVISMGSDVVPATIT